MCLCAAISIVDFPAEYAADTDYTFTVELDNLSQMAIKTTGKTLSLLNFYVLENQISLCRGHIERRH